MVEISNKKRKEFISEIDIATLLQRYDTTTILKLLQEMAYYAEPKMDWNELVKKTTTGITNSREYKILWRHLAYRDFLLPVEDDAQPLDDDSDMECELEAFPPARVNEVAEAIAHVKVMADCYVPSDSDIPEDLMVEAPLAINIPNSLHRRSQEQSISYCASRGRDVSVTFPVSFKRVDSIKAPRKRRGKWSALEEEKLIAAVKRHGEGNWTLIAKEEFEGEKTALQLSKRWGVIKRTGSQMAANLAVGSITGVEANGANNGSSLQGQQQSQPVVTSVPTAKEITPNSTSRAELMVTANSVAAAACKLSLATSASVPNVEPRNNAVPAATVMPPKPSTEERNTSSSWKSVRVQIKKTQGNRASPLVTTTLEPNKTILPNSVISTGNPVAAKLETSPSVMPKKNQVGSCIDNSSWDKPPERESIITFSPLVGAEAESKSKDEASNEKIKMLQP